jgi:hypothetical protein
VISTIASIEAGMTMSAASQNHLQQLGIFGTVPTVACSSRLFG